MRLFLKVLKTTGLVGGALLTFGPPIVSAMGIDMWKLAWEYWAIIGFIIFGSSLGSITWQLHSENKRLKIDQIKSIKCDPRFLDHCNELAQVTYNLARHVDTLLRFKENSNVTVRGNLINGVEVTSAGQIELVKIPYTFNMQYLEHHLRVDKEYPLKNLELTLEIVDLDLYKRLNTLADSRAFDLVPECPICKALLEA